MQFAANLLDAAVSGPYGGRSFGRFDLGGLYERCPSPGPRGFAGSTPPRPRRVRASSHTLGAQAVYGSIGGTVTDPSGAVLPGVTINITSLTRQTTDSVVTTENGLFVKERLLPGPYKVQAELTGFKTAVVQRIEVGVDSQTPVQFILEVGQLTD